MIGTGTRFSFCGFTEFPDCPDIVRIGAAAAAQDGGAHGAAILHDGGKFPRCHGVFRDAGIGDHRISGVELADQRIPDTAPELADQVGGHHVRRHAVEAHGGVRYTALADTRLNREVKAVTGSWHRNNFAQPDTPVSGRVLTVYIPQKTDHYAFLLSPAGKDAPEVTVLRNDEAVQAIALADGRVLAVFHQAEELILPGRSIHGEPGVYLE